MAEVDAIGKEILEGILKGVIANLTPKERKILDRCDLGNAQIAAELGCGEGTITVQLNRLYGKFGDTGIINFKGCPRKKSRLNSAWKEIRGRYIDKDGQ